MPGLLPDDGHEIVPGYIGSMDKEVGQTGIFVLGVRLIGEFYEPQLRHADSG